MKIFNTIGYNYSELSEDAKENVKKWYLFDLNIHNELFYEDIEMYLSEQFTTLFINTF